MPAAAHPFFLDLGPRRRRFCIHHAPVGAVQRCIVYTHPFAEEMNKSRRMASQCARALCAAGHAVLQIDLLGCGDSDGDIGDASWDDWVRDVVAAAQWLQQRHGRPLAFWGLRSGALLATQAAALMRQTADFVFWQPAIRGDPLLQQFLRLKVAARLHDDGGSPRESTSALRAALEAGRSVEVAGYNLPPGVALGMSSASLEPPSHPGAVTWLELSTRPDPTLLPASTTAIEHWRRAGHRVDAQMLAGPAFWSTTEIEEAPALVHATLAALAPTTSETERAT
ncbi:MAG: hypothetical protein LKCHEGNO_00085 [Burkholderiaceae bacterium]|nr:hypothetical protein [Burkholderiaceae bacterium]